MVSIVESGIQYCTASAHSCAVLLSKVQVVKLEDITRHNNSENFKEHDFREAWREFIFKFREPGREYVNTMVCVDISIHRHGVGGEELRVWRKYLDILEFLEDLIRIL
jgi:hypothetical protein